MHILLGSRIDTSSYLAAYMQHLIRFNSDFKGDIALYLIRLSLSIKDVS